MWPQRATKRLHLDSLYLHYFATAPRAQSRNDLRSPSQAPWLEAFILKQASYAWSFPAQRPWILWKTGTLVLMHRLRFFCSRTQSASDGGLDMHWWKARNCCGQLRAISSIMIWSRADMVNRWGKKSRMEWTKARKILLRHEFGRAEQSKSRWCEQVEPKK